MVIKHSNGQSAWVNCSNSKPIFWSPAIRSYHVFEIEPAGGVRLSRGIGKAFRACGFTTLLKFPSGSQFLLI